MDRAISATEANQQFSRVLREVENGESYVVTSRGRRVARIVPAELSTQREKMESLTDFLATQPVRYAGPWKREDLYD